MTEKSSCEKRPISTEKLEKVIDIVEIKLQKKYEKEVKSKDIGELVMLELHGIDEVAYVRFASVYRQFKDISHFMKELKHLLK